MRRGMTLIEVVVALAIASVVFTAVFLIYRAATTTAIHQREGERVSFAPAEVFNMLQADIAGLIPASLDEGCAVKLGSSDKTGAACSELTFCAWRAVSRNTPWNAAEKISWRVEGDAGRTLLVRTAVALAGPGSAVTTTNSFLPGIASFRLQLHDGTEWRAAWPPDGQDAKEARPRSLRVEIALDEQSKNAGWSTDFAIPTGLTVTSSVPRTAVTPAAPPRVRTR